jgi:hypothetical protein
LKKSPSAQRTARAKFVPLTFRGELCIQFLTESLILLPLASASIPAACTSWGEISARLDDSALGSKPRGAKPSGMCMVNHKSQSEVKHDVTNIANNLRRGRNHHRLAAIRPAACENKAEILLKIKG